jgi:hypothetical protein
MCNEMNEIKCYIIKYVNKIKELNVIKEIKYVTIN